MLRYLVDPANAITAVGLTLAITGIYCVQIGHLELGLAIVLWALLADHLDGIVAGRTRNRMPEKGQIGKQLDSFTDLISDAVFPVLLIVELNDRSPLSMTLGAILLLAGALRLSYFNSFGLSGNRFIGVPLSYDLPALAILFLLRPVMPPDVFPMLVNATMLVLAGLHVSTLRVPKASGAFLAGIVVFSITASAVLAARDFP
jgi:CDP-diacylglycerol---serine O-phosphatidyltransferase